MSEFDIDFPAATRNPDPPQVVISHRVKPDKHAEFAEWAEGIAKVMSQADGFLYYQSLPPVDGLQDEWMIVFQFDTPEHLRIWINSTARAELLEKSIDLVEPQWKTEVSSSALEQLLGLLPASKAKPPPIWKLMIVTWSGLFPTVTFLTYGVSRVWEHWPLIVQIMVSTACSVVLMTGIVMPTIFRLTHRWLQPGTDAPKFHR